MRRGSPAFAPRCGLPPSLLTELGGDKPAGESGHYSSLEQNGLLGRWATTGEKAAAIGWRLFLRGLHQLGNCLCSVSRIFPSGASNFNCRQTVDGSKPSS